MAEKKLSDLSTGNDEVKVDSSKKGVESKSSPRKTAKKKGKGSKPTLELSWPNFIREASQEDIEKRFTRDINKIISKYEGVLPTYCFLAIMDPESNIGAYDLDQIYNALSELNPEHDKDIFLILLSRGGSIEPSYQISKLCKSFSKEKFVVAVPRQAKSAATLIALGADQIHMGPLGQLGPIDPQLGGLPALGVSQALASIASVSEKYPGSSDMFARYLRMALTVEQIGYCERISYSAAQYAERLLLTKQSLSKKAPDIARVLVHEYKDHGFVIDIEEARQHLGSDWILDGTNEITLAEEVYKLFDRVNLFLNIYKNKRLLVLGKLDTGILIFDKQRR